MTPRRTIKVSRAGLTRCPSCNAHIQVAKDIAQTACVFCGAELGAALAQPGALERMLNAGRGGMVAASLFGFTALSACPSDTEPTSDPTADIATDIAPESVGADVAPDYIVGDVYGLPADVGVDVVPDATIDALYGLPPDVDDGPDAVPDGAIDADVTALPDVVPLYGGPPADITEGPDAVEDAAPADADGEDTVTHDAAGDADADGDAADAVFTDDLLPVPLYGIPPSADAQQ